MSKIIEVSKLPKTLVKKYSFKDLYNLKPKENGQVLLLDRKTKTHSVKNIFRAYTAYLNVPKFNPKAKNSYMFLEQSNTVPKEFQPFIDYVKKIDLKYNQMVVNWYEPNDFIELHKDCNFSFLTKSSPILCINLNETDDIYSTRSLILEHIKSKSIKSQPLLNNSYYVIKDNTNYKHCVPKGAEKRISITFRQVK